jgi:hypothetical protein
MPEMRSAQTAGVKAVYSEDFSDGQQYGGIRVENPLHDPVAP